MTPRAQLALTVGLLLVGFLVIGVVLAETPATPKPAKWITPTLPPHYLWVCYDPVDPSTGKLLRPRECRRTEAP